MTPATLRKIREAVIDAQAYIPVDHTAFGQSERALSLIDAELSKPTIPGGHVTTILKLIAEGYYRRSEDDRYIICENPSYQPDDGSEPNIVFDLATILPALSNLEGGGADKTRGTMESGSGHDTTTPRQSVDPSAGADDRGSWRCPECGCHSYARVDVKVGNRFVPGDDVRCVNCKLVTRLPRPGAALPASEYAGLVERLGHHREHPVTGAMVLINPDGPQAREAIESLERDLAEARLQQKAWADKWDHTDSRATSAERERDRLRKALTFYANEWQANGDGDDSTPGLTRTWQEPTEALWTDAGHIARATLTGDNPDD